MNYQEIEGDLIKLALQSKFDVIAHGCNCFCTMDSGITVQMAKVFHCNDFPLEMPSLKGDFNKMGQLNFEKVFIYEEKVLDMSILPEKPFTETHSLIVVNAYTQYGFGNPKGDLDYEALTLCLRKMNAYFRKKHIGLPMIGAGKAKGDWTRIKKIIQEELKDCDVTIVIWKE